MVMAGNQQKVNWVDKLNVIVNKQHWLMPMISIKKKRGDVTGTPHVRGQGAVLLTVLISFQGAVHYEQGSFVDQGVRIKKER